MECTPKLDRRSRCLSRAPAWVIQELRESGYTKLPTGWDNDDPRFSLEQRIRNRVYQHQLDTGSAVDRVKRIAAAKARSHR